MRDDVNNINKMLSKWPQFSNLDLYHKIKKNRESIRDATAELQVKIIWSCDHKYIWFRGGDLNH